jgi:polysaccharide deacetylase 2 family uncharacterized protein YibQ
MQWLIQYGRKQQPSAVRRPAKAEIVIADFGNENRFPAFDVQQVDLSVSALVRIDIG